jgi:hypothetical protein
MRTLIVLGLTVLALAVLSVHSIAGVLGGGGDPDLDGVPDEIDNCVILPNGPDLSTYFCDTQLDGDADGYGNPCDTDLDNDGAAGLSDLVLMNAAQKAISLDPVFDINCDGAAGLSDLSIVNAAQKGILAPGPSGLACAGMIPCP